MDDGTPVHCNKDLVEYIGMKKLQWPANSLDMNSLANLEEVC
jgi:hypothetical protein